MTGAGTGDDVVHIDLAPLSGIKRPSAFVDIRAQETQLFDKVQNVPPDVRLIGFRQLLYYGDRFSHRFHHTSECTILPPQVPWTRPLSWTTVFRFGPPERNARLPPEQSGLLIEEHQKAAPCGAFLEPFFLGEHLSH